jgi:hypothetical protein
MRSRAVVAVVGRFVALLVAVQGLAACAPKAKRRPVVQQTYASLPWPRPDVMELAENAWRCAANSGEFSSPMLTVIDYSLPSTEKRMWGIDMLNRRVLHHELVSHGEGSGGLHAVAFSNRLGSRQTSLGLFRTEGTYYGGNGYSLRLNGLEPGINDRALERKIVVHGARYAEPEVVTAFGTLGRSHGCPAVSHAVAGTIIDRIKGGSAVFAYYPDPDWLQTSHYLSCYGTHVARR